MTSPEREVFIPVPAFKIETTPTGVILDNNTSSPISHADLIQAMMNAGACVNFGLEPTLNTEGGVGGLYKRTPIRLENWGDGNLGVINTSWESVNYMSEREAEAIDDVLNYYEIFLMMMFTERRVFVNGKLQPADATLILSELQNRGTAWQRIMDTFRYTCGGGFPERVVKWYINTNTAQKKYLRGLTDEEI